MNTTIGRLAVLAVTVAATAAMLTGCAESPNATACKLYADGYNQVADLAKQANDGSTTITASDIRAETSGLPSKLTDAFSKATGDVAVKIRDSRDAAELFAADSSSQDAGVAFFMSSTDVAKACSDAGAPITLDKMK